MSHPGDPGLDLLERDAEQAIVTTALDRAGAGGGGVILLEGPAGIGKTRLLATAQALAADRGMAIGRARGGALEQEFAFGAVRQLFEPLVARAADSTTLFDGAAAAAGPILGRGGPERTMPNEPGIVLHGLYWLTAALAETGPLVLICDDAHWFDGPSLRFLAYLAHRVEELPLAIVVGTRPPEPTPEGELLTRLITDAATTRLRPAPLSDAAVALLVRTSLDWPADESFCHAVAEASRGNPFLVGEIVRSAQESGVVSSASSASSVLELSASSAVLGRLGRLPPHALEVARAVAILGADAQLRHAAALADLDIDDGGAAADVLMLAHILGPERPLAFVHPLVATAVYNDLLPGDRSARHRRAAQLLIADGAPPDRVATHLLVIDPAGDRPVVEVLVEAARRTLEQGATEIAIAYLRRALAEPPPSDLRLGVVFELGAAEAFVTDPAAIEHLGEAMDGFTDLPTRVMLTTARSLQLAIGGRAKEAVAALDALRPEVVGDPELALELLAGSVLVGMTGPTATPLVLDRIAELCDAVGPDGDAAPSVLGVRSFVGAFRNEPADAMATLAERALSAVSMDDPLLPLWFHLPLTVLIMADRDAEAATIIEDGLAIARRLGAPAHLGVTLFDRAWIALRAGDLNDAEADARAAVEVFELHHLDFVIPGALAILVDVLRERDDLDAADELLDAWAYESGDGDSLFHLFLLGARGRLRAAQERFDDAVADLQRGLELSRANGCTSPGFIPWHANLAMCDVIARRPTEQSRDHAAIAHQLGESFGAPRARAEGLRAVAWTDATASPDLGEEALRLFAETGAKLEEARTMIGLEVSRRGHIPVAEARDLLSRAYQLAEQAGSDRLTTLARGVLREIGAEPRRRAVTGLAALTPSERRVAALAAAGRTNKAVAQELFVTVKTVETHLAHVYQKLSISSRGELGAALSGH